MENTSDINFAILSRQARIRLLKMHYESKVGHIGGNLSCLDILLVLFQKIIGAEDIFILSKGHAAGALYIALWSINKISDRELTKFHQDGSKLSGHPVSGWIPEIHFGTGSLGHGLPLSVGTALAKKLKSEAGKVYCLMSDGEWNEGSNWEALIFAVHHRLDNLVIIIDTNGLQGFGTTADIANLEPMRAKFEAFGAYVMEVNGHDHRELEDVLANEGNPIRTIIARTKKGKGVSFMENRMEWHYLPLTKEQYIQAIIEVDA